MSRAWLRADLIRWTLLVTAAESAGFLAPAFVGVLCIGLPWYAAVPALLAAGAVEGAALGWAQATVLRDRMPSLRVRRWTVLTASAAVAAYAVGLTVAAAASASTSTWARIGVVAAGGILILISIGTAQWFELHHHLVHAGRWVAVTAAAWLVALGVFLAITTPLWHEGQRLEVAILVGAGAGVAMAFVQAALTGLWLFPVGSLTPRDSSQRSSVDAQARG